MGMKFFDITRYTRFPPEIHVMLLGTLLTRGGYYMAWPFFSITLFQKFNLSAVSIGTFLAVATACGALSGTYAGYLSDRYGRKKIITLSAFLVALGFLLLSMSHTIEGYGVSIIAVSMGCSHLESCCKALIGDRIADKNDREFCLYFRYFALNVGVSVGALLGVTFGISNPFITFLSVGVIHLIYGIILWFLLGNADMRPKLNVSSVQQSFSETCKHILGNRTFIILLICNMLIALVYANFDSTLVQYIARWNPEGGRRLVGWLIAVNAVTVIIAQFPALRLLESRSIDSRLNFGIALMFFAQILFAMAGTNNLWLLILATVILSIGELIVFPTFSVKIDRLTPSDLRGSFFGAGSLYALGSAVAPLLGGVMLQYGGGVGLFSILAVLCLFVLILNTVARRKNLSVAPDTY